MPSKIKARGNGRYLLSVAVGYDTAGKQVVKTKTIKAAGEREAKREYNLFAAAVLKGEVGFTGKHKLGEFASYWFHQYCQKTLAPKTQRSYKNQLEKRILPVLGYIPIEKLRPQHIMSFIDNMQKQGKRFDGKPAKISGASAEYSFRVLSSMLQDAVQWQVISSNPCARVKPPTAKATPINILNENEIQKMLAVLGDEPLKYRMLVMLAIDSGLRLGEIMGLQWKDLDMERGILKVTRTNQALRGKGIFTKKPKTLNSVRSIALSSSVMDLFKEYRKVQLETQFMLGNKWVNTGWIFTKWNGEAMYPTTPSQWFQRFLKRQGLPHMSFHGLRHLSATILIALHVPLKNVSSRLGHADIRTTANIYGLALQSVDKQAADKMDQYLKKMKCK